MDSRTQIRLVIKYWWKAPTKYLRISCRSYTLLKLRIKVVNKNYFIRSLAMLYKGLQSWCSTDLTILHPSRDVT